MTKKKTPKAKKRAVPVNIEARLAQLAEVIETVRFDNDHVAATRMAAMMGVINTVANRLDTRADKLEAIQAESMVREDIENSIKALHVKFEHVQVTVHDKHQRLEHLIADRTFDAQQAEEHFKSTHDSLKAVATEVSRLADELAMRTQADEKASGHLNDRFSVQESCVDRLRDKINELRDTLIGVAGAMGTNANVVKELAAGVQLINERAMNSEDVPTLPTNLFPGWCHAVHKGKQCDKAHGHAMPHGYNAPEGVLGRITWSDPHPAKHTGLHTNDNGGIWG